MPPNRVVDRVALGDPPYRAGMADHAGVVEPHGGLEARQSRRDHLGAAAEPCEEVRLYETRRDPEVGGQPVPVEPDRDTVGGLPTVFEILLRERVVVHHAVVGSHLWPEHAV